MSVALAGLRPPTISRPAGAEGGPAALGSAVSARPAPLSPHERSTAVKVVGGAANSSGTPAPNPSADGTGAGSDAEEEGVVAASPTIEDSPPPGFDEAAEQVFLSEAKERGEVVQPKTPAEVEEAAPKTLPKLDDLVQQIPAQVRDVLEDLFRARFVTVKRFPKKALKTDS